METIHSQLLTPSSYFILHILVIEYSFSTDFPQKLASFSLCVVRLCYRLLPPFALSSFLWPARASLCISAHSVASSRTHLVPESEAVVILCLCTASGGRASVLTLQHTQMHLPKFLHTVAHTPAEPGKGGWGIRTTRNSSVGRK